MNKYGRLSVIAPSERREKNGGKFFLFGCDCGVIKEIAWSSVRRGHTQSCGCLGREQRALAHSKRRLPFRKSITYKSWEQMKQRCYNPHNPKYIYYGGRGIGVDISWLDSFDMFLADMGFRPSIQHCLDRIDPEQHYCQSNCRWILKSENVRRTTVCRDDSTGRFITRWR